MPGTLTVIYGQPKVGKTRLANFISSLGREAAVVEDWRGGEDWAELARYRSMADAGKHVILVVTGRKSKVVHPIGGSTGWHASVDAVIHLQGFRKRD